jgi:endogenous inhibitor of DNA gyrase (YacG/DUF329 family)
VLELSVSCEECGEEFEYVPGARNSKRFCSDRCRYRNRDRRRYAENPERERAKSRAYYAANRERVIERVKARKAARVT